MVEFIYVCVGARSSMDRASASEAENMGSTPVGRKILRALGLPKARVLLSYFL